MSINSPINSYEFPSHLEDHLSDEIQQFRSFILKEIYKKSTDQEKREEFIKDTIRHLINYQMKDIIFIWESYDEEELIEKLEKLKEYYTTPITYLIEEIKKIISTPVEEPKRAEDIYFMHNP